MEKGDSAAGVVLDLERIAMRGGALPDGLDLFQQVFFLGLRELYAQCRAGFITREMGTREKKLLVGQCEERERVWRFKEHCWEHAATLWRDVEQAANAYRKERTLEHADGLIKAIYGVGIPKEDNPKRFGI